jgi:hypothetical protein
MTKEKSFNGQDGIHKKILLYRNWRSGADTRIVQLWLSVAITGFLDFVHRSEFNTGKHNVSETGSVSVLR